MIASLATSLEKFVNDLLKIFLVFILQTVDDLGDWICGHTD
jgi:hypothetical protein